MSTKDQLFRNIMQTKPTVNNKITVIGVGSVGMAVTFSILAQVSLCFGFLFSFMIPLHKFGYVIEYIK